MDKKYFSPVLLIGIGAAFLIVCLLLYFKGGKSAGLIAGKMRLGALLLSLGSFASCGGGGGEVMCYATESVDLFELKNATVRELLLNVDSSRTVEGNIFGVVRKEYSYAVYDLASEKRLAEGDIDYQIQETDSSVADFSFELDNTLDTGMYQLQFYTFSAADNDSVPFSSSIILNLIK